MVSSSVKVYNEAGRRSWSDELVKLVEKVGWCCGPRAEAWANKLERGVKALAAERRMGREVGSNMLNGIDIDDGDLKMGDGFEICRVV